MTQLDAAPQTAARLSGFAPQHHGDRRAVRAKRNGAWEDRTYADVGEDIERLATGLLAHGIDAGDRVCVLADTRPEWSIAANAIWSIGSVVVPIYPASSPDECAWVVGNSGGVAVVVEDAAQLAKIAAVRDAVPALRATFIVEGRDASDGVVTLEAVAAAGGDSEEFERRPAAVAADDPALITDGDVVVRQVGHLRRRGAPRGPCREPTVEDRPIMQVATWWNPAAPTFSASTAGRSRSPSSRIPTATSSSSLQRRER